MMAVGTPTTRLRFVKRFAELSPILQQQFLVVLEPGTARERNRWVWLDITTMIETPQEQEARLEIEKMGKMFTTPGEQLVR